MTWDEGKGGSLSMTSVVASVWLFPIPDTVEFLRELSSPVYMNLGILSNIDFGTVNCLIPKPSRSTSPLTTLLRSDARRFLRMQYMTDVEVRVSTKTTAMTIQSNIQKLGKGVR